MILLHLSALLLAAAPQAAAPTATMTEVHKRDLGCVAFFGVAAGKQRQGINGYELIPDVRTDGPRWAGIVGDRVMRETGLPQEVVGYAIQQSVPGAQRVFMLNNPTPTIERRVGECVPLMRRDLTEADAVSKPLPKPQKSKRKP
jgi:hypothetical protein